MTNDCHMFTCAFDEKVTAAKCRKSPQYFSLCSLGVAVFLSIPSASAACTDYPVTMSDVSATLRAMYHVSLCLRLT